MGTVLTNLPMVTESIPVHYAVTPIQRPVAPEIDAAACLYKIVTPYQPHSWELSLHESGLLYTFPNLISDLTYGTPISNPPILSHTFIPNNLKMANLDPAYMGNFLALEVATGQINSPFTVDQAHTLFGGHFCTAPLGLVEKPRSTALRMIHNHSKEDHLRQATNTWLDPSVNATKYFSAADAVDFVSLFSTVLCYLPPCHLSYYSKTHMYFKRWHSTTI